MAPLSQRYSLVNRYSGNQVIGSVEPFKTYYILCEGIVTEPKYFCKLYESKNLNVRQRIEVIVLKRDGNQDKGKTDPFSMRDLMINYIKENGRKNDAEYVLVFDTDVIRNSPNYKEFINETERDFGIRIFGTSPCIELWFILHEPNSLQGIIIPQQEKIFLNEKVSDHHTYTSLLCSQIWHSNPKKHVNIYMVDYVHTAIEQAKKIETNIEYLNIRIGTNLHILIEELIEDKRFEK